MQLKKLLALLLSAALALSLLAGCGGESVARSLLALLDGKYANVSVEMDPDLEADLRQALSETENDDEAAIRAALETLLGSTITFRYLGEGQQGDTAFDLIFYAGADPDKAAQAAYSQWNLVFANVPADGQYDTALAMVETNSGIWMLVKATVEKAGSRDDDDDDDEPEDEKVEGNGFTYNVTKKTITVKPDSGETNGLQELFFDAGVDDKVEAARADGFAGVTIELAAGSYSVNSTFTTTFKGILKGKSPDEKATIKLQAGSKGLFVQIGEDGSGPENNGTVENITFDVQTTITDTYAGGNHFAGAVAGMNNGNITNCKVTINGGRSITATNSDNRSYVCAGGLVGYNYGTITNCTVTINGSISATGGSADAGGIAGYNQGKIKGDNQVTIEGGENDESDESGESGGSIRAQATSVDANAGGLVGRSRNTDTVVGTCSFGEDNPKAITARVGSDKASVPDSDNSDKDDNLNTDTQGSAYAGTKIGYDWNAEGPVGK